MSEDKLLTVAEVAERLRLSKRTILGYLRAGKLEGVQVGTEGSGRRWRVPESEINSYIEKRRGGGESK